MSRLSRQLVRRPLTGAVIGLLGVCSLAACSSGSSNKAPTSLSLSGQKVPVTQVTTGISNLCVLLKTFKSDPTASRSTYFDGPYAPLHVLAAALKGAPSNDLLSAMAAYERDLLMNPAPAATVTTGNALVASADSGLRTLKVKPPTCST
jgi:hypothetical protein